jgi:hypothetical protein
LTPIVVGLQVEKIMPKELFSMAAWWRCCKEGMR